MPIQTPLDVYVKQFVNQASEHNLYIDASGEWTQVSVVTRLMRWVVSWIPFSHYVVDSTVDRCNKLSLTFIRSQLLPLPYLQQRYATIIQLAEAGAKHQALQSKDNISTKRIFLWAQVDLHRDYGVDHHGQLSGYLADGIASEVSTKEHAVRWECEQKRRTDVEVEARKTSAAKGTSRSYEETIKTLTAEIDKLKAAAKKEADPKVQADNKGAAAIPPAQNAVTTADDVTAKAAAATTEKAKTDKAITDLQNELRLLKEEQQKAIEKAVSDANAKHNSVVTTLNKTSKERLDAATKQFNDTLAKRQSEIDALQEEMRKLKANDLSSSGIIVTNPDPKPAVVAAFVNEETAAKLAEYEKQITGHNAATTKLKSEHDAAVKAAVAQIETGVVKRVDEAVQAALAKQAAENATRVKELEEKNKQAQTALTQASVELLQTVSGMQKEHASQLALLRNDANFKAKAIDKDGDPVGKLTAENRELATRIALLEQELKIKSGTAASASASTTATAVASTVNSAAAALLTPSAAAAVSALTSQQSLTTPPTAVSGKNNVVGMLDRVPTPPSPSMNNNKIAEVPAYQLLPASQPFATAPAAGSPSDSAATPMLHQLPPPTTPPTTTIAAPSTAAPQLSKQTSFVLPPKPKTTQSTAAAAATSAATSTSSAAALVAETFSGESHNIPPPPSDV